MAFEPDGGKWNAYEETQGGRDSRQASTGDVLTAQGLPVGAAACMKNAGGDTRGIYPEDYSPLILAAASPFS